MTRFVKVRQLVDTDGSTVRRNRRALRELSQSSSPHPQPACPQLEHTGVKVSRYGRTIKAIRSLICDHRVRLIASLVPVLLLSYYYV